MCECAGGFLCGAGLPPPSLPRSFARLRAYARMCVQYARMSVLRELSKPFVRECVHPAARLTDCRRAETRSFSFVSKKSFIRT
jgi:hypothetical protein